MADPSVQAKSGLTLWKASRWLVLFALILIILLMLRKPPPVAEPMAPAAAKEQSDAVQSKMADLEASHNRGEVSEARFSSQEINGVLQQAQAEPEAPAAAAQLNSVRASQPPTGGAETLPEITTTRLAFEGDQAVGQFVVHGPAGKDIYLTISGKIRAVNGYASFEFTEGKIGDMPVPAALLNARLQAKLQEPETRPKLKLPDYISDIYVENGQLVMTEK